MYDITKLENTLKAGAVQRYHATPLVKQQSVAEHSWNVAMIYMELSRACGFTSDASITEALFHDIGELFTGDVPFTLKREFPAVKNLYDGLEEHYSKQFINRSSGERHLLHNFLLKIADWLEGMRWCAYYEVGTEKDIMENYAQGIETKYKDFSERHELTYGDALKKVLPVVEAFFLTHFQQCFPIIEPTGSATPKYVKQ